MNRRTQLLAGLFAGVVALAVIGNTVYPRWIEPLLKIDDRIAERKAELERLEALQADFDQARQQYVECVHRLGSIDVLDVETSVRERLNKLINKYELDQAHVAPNRGAKDRKTGLTQLTLAVSAEGTLESAVGFLRDVSELPELLRVNSVSLYPLSSPREEKQVGRRKQERVTLRALLEVQVLPEQKLLGKKLAQESFEQPEQKVRHAGLDYRLIWERTPFSEYVPLDPLRVTVSGATAVEVGKPAALQASAVGGDGEYTFKWTPAEGLTDPAGARTNIDTSASGRFVYNVVVSDNSGNTASGQATVDVRVPPPPPTQVAQTDDRPPPPPPPPPKPERKKSFNANDLRLTMALVSIENGTQRGGVVVYNPRNGQTDHYAVGDPFEGGLLVYVHPRAALVEWEGKYFAYPVGSSLAEDVNVEASENFPFLDHAVSSHRQALLVAAQGPIVEEVVQEQPPVVPAAQEAALPPDGSLELEPAGVPSTPAASEAVEVGPPAPSQEGQPPVGADDAPPAAAPEKVPEPAQPPVEDAKPAPDKPVEVGDAPETSQGQDQQIQEPGPLAKPPAESAEPPGRRPRDMRDYEEWRKRMKEQRERARERRAEPGEPAGNDQPSNSEE